MFDWLFSLFTPNGQTPQQFVQSAIRQGLDQEFGLSDRLEAASGWISNMTKTGLNWFLNLVLDAMPNEAEERIDRSLEGLQAARDAAGNSPELQAVLDTAYTAAHDASNGGVDRLMSRFGGETMALQVASAVYNEEFERKAEAVLNQVYDRAAGAPHTMDAAAIANMRSRLGSYLENGNNWSDFATAYPDLYAEIILSAERASGLSRAADGTFTATSGGVYGALLSGTAPALTASNFAPVSDTVIDGTLDILELQVEAGTAVEASASIFSGLSADEKTALADRIAADFRTGSTVSSAADASITDREFDLLSRLSVSDKQDLGSLIADSLGSGATRRRLADIDIEDVTSGSTISVTIHNADGTEYARRTMNIS